MRGVGRRSLVADRRVRPGRVVVGGPAGQLAAKVLLDYRAEGLVFTLLAGSEKEHRDGATRLDSSPWQNGRPPSLWDYDGLHRELQQRDNPGYTCIASRLRSANVPVKFRPRDLQWWA